MKEQTLLFVIDDQPIKPTKKYSCKTCGGQKTVAWVMASQSYICSACGKIDRRRTEQAKEKA